MLRTRRHYILSAPRGFQMENRFFLGLFPEFFGFKKFLTKTLLLLRHSMPLKSAMVWVPLCSTLKTITAMSNTDYPAQYTIPVRDLDEDWFREQDWQKPLRRLFVFSFKLSPSENTERIVNSPNFLFLILKTKKLCSN